MAQLQRAESKPQLGRMRCSLGCTSGGQDFEQIDVGRVAITSVEPPQGPRLLREGQTAYEIVQSVLVSAIDLGEVGPSGLICSGSYLRAGVRADLAITEQLSIGVGARNLFDAYYALTDGFPEAGRSFFAVARAVFISIRVLA